MPTIGELIKQRASLSPNLEALVSHGKRITYKEYNEMVNQLAHYLLDINVQHGERVALLTKNSYAFPIIYLAAAKIGAITVPINCRLKSNEVQWIVEDCQPKVLFYDEEFSEALTLLQDSPFLQHTIRVENAGEIDHHFNSLFIGSSHLEPNIPIHEHDVATIIYTSGTTGNPKGVICTHGNVYAAGLANVNTVDLRFGDRFLFVTPLFHISGMMFIINALIRGMTIVIAPHFHPVQIWDLIEYEKITNMMSVPSMLSYMLQGIKSSEREIATLRGIVCGGSLVPEALIREFHELGFPIIQVYGATEFTGAITYFLPDFDIERCNSVGKGLYLTEIQILDPLTGSKLPPGEIGEIVVRGDQVFTGYWNNKEESDQVLRNGWYHTKDVGMLDSDGYLYVIDRLRDMIICSGEKVFPAQVESVIQQLPEVADVAVVGVKHPVWGELPRAYVVKKKEANITETDILAYTRQYLADYKLHDVVFIEELPKNSMGKTLKYVLREYANINR